MKICEVCGQEHDGSFGSGRFCSKKCACAFGAKASAVKRRENGTLDSSMAKARMNVKNNKNPPALNFQPGGNCQFCGKECHNRNSLINHERCCSKNPNRAQIFRNGPSGNLSDWNKNHLSWNKGFTKETNESVARSAIGAKNFANSEKHKEWLREFNKEYWTEEHRKAKSEEKKKFFNEHPEMHPNRKVANNRSKMTYPEEVAFTWLKEHNISFEHQKQFGKYFTDFYIQDKNMVIEIDGERWHDVEYDTARDAWIVENFGVVIIRISTKEKIVDGLSELFES